MYKQTERFFICMQTLRRYCYFSTLLPCNGNSLFTYRTFCGQEKQQERKVECIRWETSLAPLVEHLMKYEQVHPFNNIYELKERLGHDRRCLAVYENTSKENLPLVFVWVALMKNIPTSIHQIIPLHQENAKNNIQDEPISLPTQEGTDNTVAVFYSINAAHSTGEKGLGNYLIKQSVKKLSKELPSLKTFVTLSPVPGFVDWLENSPVADEIMKKESSRTELAFIKGVNQAKDRFLSFLKGGAWLKDREIANLVEPTLITLCKHYLVHEKSPNGKPRNVVANFHTRNGASLHGIHFLADTSNQGLAQSISIMVNYLYRIEDIEENIAKYKDGDVVVTLVKE